MNKLIRIIYGFIIVTFFTAGSFRAVAEDDPSPIPGAALFVVSIYDHPRADKDSKKIATGAFLFAGQVISRENMPEDIRSTAFRVYESLHFPYSDPNGCFIMFNAGGKNSFALLAPYGLIGWQKAPSGALMSGLLFQSPDTNYGVTFRVSGDRVEGEGRGHFGFGHQKDITEYYDGEVLPVYDLTDCFRTSAEGMKKKWSPEAG